MTPPLIKFRDYEIYEEDIRPLTPRECRNGFFCIVGTTIFSVLVLWGLLALVEAWW